MQALEDIANGELSSPMDGHSAVANSQAVDSSEQAPDLPWSAEDEERSAQAPLIAADNEQLQGEPKHMDRMEQAARQASIGADAVANAAVLHEAANAFHAVKPPHVKPMETAARSVGMAELHADDKAHALAEISLDVPMLKQIPQVIVTKQKNTVPNPPLHQPCSIC